MRLNIDIEKSIESRELVSTSNFSKFFDFFVAFFITIAFIIIIIAPVKGEKIEITAFKIVMIASTLLISRYGIIIARRMGKLVLLDGWNKSFDRNQINKLAIDKNWPLVKEGGNLIVFRADNRMSNVRQVSFLLGKESLYVSVMSFGMHGIISPIYFASDKKVLNQIIKELTLHNNR